MNCLVLGGVSPTGLIGGGIINTGPTLLEDLVTNIPCGSRPKVTIKCTLTFEPVAFFDFYAGASAGPRMSSYFCHELLGPSCEFWDVGRLTNCPSFLREPHTLKVPQCVYRHCSMCCLVVWFFRCGSVAISMAWVCVYCIRLANEMPKTTEFGWK